MILIAHRGNIHGPDSKLQNKPLQIQKALDLGYNCEIDVWYINGEFLLGHDEPKYKIYERSLENSKLWCHAKNLDALVQMLNNKKINCFWHEEDKYTITSSGYIWCFPDVYVQNKCIQVHKGKKVDHHNYKCDGICSDYIETYKDV